ncbi:hypothetical protein SeMB42_g00658 [Synchytrium endobioticum]|uniref:Ribosomal protein L7/L12 C-terminal domain-containing protein n=1 Tax=Synchytrium endobioticum TaxID=286115 RepID=A0A507D275_9FUNG|nr:hypothetical protein SeLEV6574_g03799 [Synchytrium endobioticum]TPX53628.1 hypothetical protein SeMB42_g00658 [Synchytrium endobioticum]
MRHDATHGDYCVYIQVAISTLSSHCPIGMAARIIPKLSATRISSIWAPPCISSMPAIHRALSSTSIRLNPDIDPKISSIVDSIAGLTLLQTASLVKELKTRLNIQDVAMPAFQPQFAAAAAQAAAASQPAAAPAQPVEEEKEPEKTDFKVKLEKFNADAKAKIIREIKALIPGANLVEAKKFVESVPKVIREGVPKEEAEKMKKLLEGLGATVILE